MELFDYLNGLTHKKEEQNFEDEEVSKGYFPYIISRWISMTEAFIPLVNEVNKYSDIPKQQHYNFFLTTIPKRKNFFEYIKKKKEVDDAEKKLVAHYFECSLKEAEEYCDILDNEQIKEIINIYRFGRNDIIKI